MPAVASRILFTGLCLTCLTPMMKGADDLVCFAPDESSGSSGAVKVGAVCLTHTEQALPVNREGRLTGQTVAEQLRVVQTRLEAAGHNTGAGLDRCVKLNIYLRDTNDADVVRAALAKRFHGAHKPAVCLVTTKLPLEGALVAADAIIATPRESRSHVELLPAEGPRAGCAVLRPGGRVYIAGQAEPGDLASATRKTLESLRKTLAHLKLDLSHVVQIKSFLTPMGEVAVAEREIRSFFGEQATPPLVFVEWIAGSASPIEIELIAACPRDQLPADAPPVEYLTPPGMTASPIFARVTRVAAPETIYVSGLYGPDADAERQVRSVFEQLTELLAPAGSGLRHLVKATYYVADEPASAMLNKLRPEYYDPGRPPAASKAPVHGVGRAERTLTLDMIAVPGK